MSLVYGRRAISNPEIEYAETLPEITHVGCGQYVWWYSPPVRQHRSLMKLTKEGLGLD